MKTTKRRVKKRPQSKEIAGDAPPPKRLRSSPAKKKNLPSRASKILIKGGQYPSMQAMNRRLLAWEREKIKKFCDEKKTFGRGVKNF